MEKSRIIHRGGTAAASHSVTDAPIDGRGTLRGQDGIFAQNNYKKTLAITQLMYSNIGYGKSVF